jgi:predicted nucleotidyltransferase
MNQEELGRMRTAYQQDLSTALTRIVGVLSKIPQVHQVMLLGSYAAGRRDLFTDLDILVVMESEDDFITRSIKLRQKLQAGVDMDLLVYTPIEFVQMSRKGYLNQALNNCQVLYNRS